MHQCNTTTPGSTLLLCCCRACRYGLLNDKCRLCRVGTYGAGAATGNICWDCPQGGWTTLQPGSTSFEDCVCDVGHGNDGCVQCDYPFYQGYLNDFGVPVTSATPGNPTPLCLRCNADDRFTRLGSPDRTCVTAGSGLPGAYCVKVSLTTAPPCADPDGRRMPAEEPLANTTRPGGV